MLLDNCTAKGSMPPDSLPQKTQHHESAMRVTASVREARSLASRRLLQLWREITSSVCGRFRYLKAGNVRLRTGI